MRVQIGDQIWDKARVQSNLSSQKPEFVARALLVIYARQTTDEQFSLATKHVNARGFNSVDAAWLSRTAERYKKWGRWRNAQSCARVAGALRKYWRQLLDEIASKEGAVVLDKAEPEIHPDDVLDWEAERLAEAADDMRAAQIEFEGDALIEMGSWA